MHYNLQPVHNKLTHDGTESFSSSQCKLIWSNPSLKVSGKGNLSTDQIGRKEKPIHRKEKPIILVKAAIPCQLFKQKHFYRNGFSKGFARFWIDISGGGQLQKSCNFNFTKDRPHLVVPPGFLKIFRATILWTPEASYFDYYIIPRSFLLATRAFISFIYAQRLFNFFPNFVIFNHITNVFSHKRHIFSSVLKIFYVSTDLK